MFFVKGRIWHYNNQRERTTVDLNCHAEETMLAGAVTQPTLAQSLHCFLAKLTFSVKVHTFLHQCVNSKISSIRPPELSKIKKVKQGVLENNEVFTWSLLVLHADG